MSHTAAMAAVARSAIYFGTQHTSVESRRSMLRLWRGDYWCEGCRKWFVSWIAWVTHSCDKEE